MSWSFTDNGKLEPIAMPKRRQVQIYVGRRFLPAAEYVRAAGKIALEEFSFGGNIRAIWKAVKRRHRSIRLVRVNVTTMSEGEQHHG